MDFITDQSGRHLLRLSTTLQTVPEFVKSASVLAEDVAALGAHQFARPSRREFPIDTPGHVFLSYGYCKSAGIEDADLLQTLRQAAGKFGLAQELETIDATFAGLEKQASGPEPLFAVYLDLGAAQPEAEHPLLKSGGVQGFYPINSEEEVKASAFKLVHDREKLPLECFVDGCRSLVKRAGDLNISRRMLPRLVDDYGTPRVVDFDLLEQQAQARERATGDTLYGEIVKSAQVNAERQPMSAYLGLWKQADDQNGVVYSKSTWDPYRLFNSGITQAAYDQELEKWATVNSVPVPCAALARLSLTKLAKFFPQKLTEALSDLVKKAAVDQGTEVSHLIETQLDADSRTTLLRLLAA